MIARSKRLKGTHICLGGVFGSSVLATANVMMAAVLADGETIIEPAACEPEIGDLSNCLIEMGAKIKGVGSPRLTIRGVSRLHGVDYRIIPDRIEAGTFILIAAATRSPFIIKNACFQHLMTLVDVLHQAGIDVIHENNQVCVKAGQRFHSVSVATHPYPGFPTDLQAQFMALMVLADGVSVITDRVYPDRVNHIAELNRMGADIHREGDHAIVKGVKSFFGAPVMASDLRASAALVVAGLAAKGRTEVRRIYHLERGYENFDQKLAALGANVWKEKE